MVTAPERVWWRVPVSRAEMVWIVLAFLLVMVFFSLWMALWHGIGRQNATGAAYKVAPQTYREEVFAFARQWKVGEENGIPVVAPPPGSHVYLLAQRFSWYPILKLKAGETYHLHMASTDVLHGFSLSPHQWAIQLYPGYEWVMSFTPDKPGTYHIICNDFCGLGHQTMLGKIIVEG
ncbi:Cytochrome c oxidase subunit 2 [bacterium HR23]|nr:Cytochrome c oxidase subunit 2 [bacterium HR23]